MFVADAPTITEPLETDVFTAVDVHLYLNFTFEASPQPIAYKWILPQIYGGKNMELAGGMTVGLYHTYFTIVYIPM